MRKLMLSASGVLLALGVATVEGAVRDYPIQPVPFTNVKLEDGFWSPRLETNRVTTVWYDFKKCEETGRIDNFAKAGKLMEGPFRGTPFDDSDVFKVIEGAAYSLALRPDPQLDRYLDDLIRKIAAAQEPDGYLYSARTIDPKSRVDFFGPDRWTKLERSHELYNIGHLYEAAAAHFNATGKSNLLAVALKSADLVCKTFGPAADQLKEPPGHQEIEIGLVKLFRVTGDRKYLDQAKFFLDLRGRADRGTKLRGPYQQDHLPVIDQAEAVGHAVRACYLYAGMTDVAAMTDDEAYIKALDALWDNVVSKKLHITGGVGARHAGEAFGDAYELPNASAYNETCAAIACALWAQRMFLLKGDSSYIDVFERILFNGFLSGVAMTGDTFFYPNPLAWDGRTKFNHGVAGRAPWFGCSCCPVNVVRIVPSVPGWIYAVRDNRVYVNLFAGGEATVPVRGREMKLRQQTRYPWDGTVNLSVEIPVDGAVALCIRIPGWARGEAVPSDLYAFSDGLKPAWSISVNGEKESVAAMDKGYAVLDRAWKEGDRVTVSFDMPARRVASHPAVKDNAGRVALQRGPVVYCLEAADNGGAVSDLVLDAAGGIESEFRADLLNGVTVLRGGARRLARAEDGSVRSASVPFTAVPYHAWAHRGPGEMAVWIAAKDDVARVKPPPSLAGRARVESSHTHAADAREAVNDGELPKSSGDHGLPRFTWWDHRGTKEWIAYRWQEPVKVSTLAVYWFDDTGRGQCRVPASWTVDYLDGDDWKPVPNMKGGGTGIDRFNESSFDPVTTRGVRLNVNLQPTFSGGVLEWQVK